ncbi:MAG: hypothetical protein Q4F25_00510 [Eubacteriales bacterium]|nr:hypothetical protein [Eubacteriales bacterium]
MAKQIFREKARNRLSSPEQLNDYLRVTGSAVWVTLAAVILLLAGALFWASVTMINSSVSGSARVRDGMMTIVFDDDAFADELREGQEVIVGETSVVMLTVSRREDGRVTATAGTYLADGLYPAEAVYSRTRVIEMLFN